MQKSELRGGKQAFTFSIANLLVLTLVIAMVLVPVSLWGADGIGSSVLIVLGLVFVLTIWMVDLSTSAKICWSGVLLLLMAGLITDFVPLQFYGRRPGVGSQCMNHARQLSLACHNYHSAYGRFPPAFTTDVEGRPLHSWRVLILPFIEEQALYNDLDLSKPWNHPSNIQHADRMPDLFLCPADGMDLPGRFAHVKTPYVAIVGAGTIWDAQLNGVTLADVHDSASQTIMLLESDVHSVHWMSPSDIDIADIVAVNEEGETDVISSHHPGGTNVVMADGSSRFVAETVKAEKLRAAATIQGGEDVDVSCW